MPVNWNQPSFNVAMRDEHTVASAWFNFTPRARRRWARNPSWDITSLSSYKTRLASGSPRQDLHSQYGGLSSTSFGTSCMVLDGLWKSVLGPGKVENVSLMSTYSCLTKTYHIQLTGFISWDAGLRRRGSRVKTGAGRQSEHMWLKLIFSGG